MEMDSGKLFVGGISWDTNEDRLREYFQSFGEVVEAVIMKDRNTGRARGFGFVVFADPYVAERVVKEKHIIDGRTVEAKKAVPRDDQNSLTRSNAGSNQGSPSPARTKKIFVGGLASTVNESDFKKYFEQFGTITDVVVMYDHNTKRPRGFGFITYNSEEAVDRVLLKTFHELNGKMVEVKRAVPKELSPGPARSPLGGYSHGLNRMNSFLNAFPQGYNTSPMAGYGVRMDGRFSPVTVGRSGYLPFNSSNYAPSMGPNMDSGMSSEFGGAGNYSPNLGYGRSLNPLQNAFSNRFNNSVGYGMGIGGSGSLVNSSNRNMWGNGSLNYDGKSANSNDFAGTGSGTSELLGAFGNIGAIWGSSHGSGQGGGSASYGNNYGNAEDSFMAGGGYGKVSGSNVEASPPYGARGDSRDMAFNNLYGRNTIYEDPTWQSSSPELANSGNFSYRLGDAGSNVPPNNSVGYVGGGYSVANRAARGIAA